MHSGSRMNSNKRQIRIESKVRNTQVVLSSLKVAVVVGTVLNLINQYQPLLALDFAKVAWGKFTLTYFVPFLVSLYSSAITTRKHYCERKS